MVRVGILVLVALLIGACAGPELQLPDFITTVQEPEAPVARTHTVEEGETLHGVAARWDISVAALVWANGLRGSRLTAGQVLTIPDRDLSPPPVPFTPYIRATVLTRGAASRQSVALTFDAGADRGNAESILDTLRDRGIRASFGIMGLWAQQNPDLVGRMVAEGHRLINHSWDHTSFTGISTRTHAISSAARWSQLERTDALLLTLTGQSSRPFFRSPYGDTDASVQLDIAQRGYAYNVLWTVDSGGWSGSTAQQIIERCVRAAAPGAIYVLHVGAASQDGLATDAIIVALTTAGYDFETIDEIIEP